MKKIFFLPLLLFISINLKAQSVYLDTLKNAFSGTYAFSSSENYNASAFGVSYTIKSSINLGLIYTLGNQSIEENEDNFEGSGFGGYISFMLLNELKEAPIGIELGILYQSISLDENSSRGSSSDRIENRSFGIGLIFSQQPTASENNFLTFQGGFTAFPISENEYFNNESSGGISTDPFFTGHFALGVVFGKTSSLKFIIEPSINHNFTNNISTFSLSISAIL